MGLGGCAGDFRQAIDPLQGLGFERCGIRAQLGQQGRHNAFTVLQERCQQMQGKHLRIAVLRRKIVRLLDRFL